MRPVQRLEIIIERTLRDRVLAALTHAGVDGWTILPVTTGQGGRGPRGLEGLPGALENDLILSAVEGSQLDTVLEELRPLLERWGGVCLVSDARWLKHERPQI